MKAFLRFLSFLLLIAAVFLGVLDSIRSVSTSSVNITGILSVWNYLLPASRTMVETALAHYIHPEAWRFIENALSGLRHLLFPRAIPALLDGRLQEAQSDEAFVSLNLSTDSARAPQM